MHNPDSFKIPLQNFQFDESTIDPAHLQFINPNPRAQEKEQSTFHLFRQLPAELRIKIWRIAFTRQRIIKLQLTNGSTSEQNEEPVYDDFGDFYSLSPLEEPYMMWVHGYQLMNKFLRVCQESRQEVLTVYRVHIPCRLTTNHRDSWPDSNIKDTKPGLLYFSPEHDYLHIRNFIPPYVAPHVFFADFITRLKNIYDPRHVGLLKLVLDRGNHGSIFDLDSKAHILAPVSDAFRETIMQLQELWFSTTQNFGRLNFINTPGILSTDVLFTRSFPIKPLTRNFEFQGPDPRPISQDLKKMNIEDPRGAFCEWRAGLKKFDVPVSDATRYKFAIRNKTPGQPIDRNEARKMLAWQEEIWKNPELGKGKTIELEDLDKVARPAFGFWLFSIDAFGGFGPNGDPLFNGETDGRDWKDLSNFYPELALSVL